MSNKNSTASKENLVCGLVMPISTIDGCNEQHWIDVKEIISEAIKDAGFTPNLVSYADDVGIIQKRIIQNLYENPIVVCDVSGKNPNVMFELGLRLAFDKPTIIIKDDKTSYSFDTSPIEHLDYPRDLRFTKIIEFKQNLNEKVKATYKKSKDDKDYTTFLKHFGSFTVAKIDTKELSKEDYIIEELKDLKKTIIRQENKAIIHHGDLFPHQRTMLNSEKNQIIKHLKFSIERELMKFPIPNNKIDRQELKHKIRNKLLNNYPEFSFELDQDEFLEIFEDTIKRLLS